MSESTVHDVRTILDLVSNKDIPMTPEESAHHAARLSGFLYRLLVLENEAKRQCDIKLMQILGSQVFWARMKMKPAKSTAEAQLYTEPIYQQYLDLSALRTAAQETVRSLRSMTRLYEEERRTFTS